MLRIENFSVAYGAVQAVKGLNLVVPKGDVVGLVGANGAGKTSTLNGITGLVSNQGKVTFKDRDISRMATADIVRRGLVQVAQGRLLFPDMTVRENLEMGGFLQDGKNMHEQIDKMTDQFPVLRERIGQRAGTLSGGEQQMLAVARALMARPDCLLIDEPCLGLAPKIVEKMAEIISTVNQAGISILLVEQNTNFVFGLASYAYVLENGRLVLEGSPEQLRQDDKVRSAYLGI